MKNKPRGTKVIRLPVRNLEPAEVFRCPVCDWPSLTLRGGRMHYTLSHGASEFADRNWGIAYSHIKEGTSVAELTGIHELSEVSIRRIIQRALMFPHIYDLDEDAIAQPRQVGHA